MLGSTGDGLHDHRFQFTKPVSGAYWFAPAAEDLAELLDG